MLCVAFMVKKFEVLCRLVGDAPPNVSKGLFIFMVTVLQRSIALNVELTKQQLSVIGDRVSTSFIARPGTFQRTRMNQVENGISIAVWHYPDSFASTIDEIILSTLKPKRKRIDQAKVKI